MPLSPSVLSKLKWAAQVDAYTRLLYFREGGSTWAAVPYAKRRGGMLLVLPSGTISPEELEEAAVGDHNNHYFLSFFYSMFYLLPQPATNT